MKWILIFVISILIFRNKVYAIIFARENLWFLTVKIEIARKLIL